MTRPVEWAAAGAPVLERFVVTETLDREGRADRGSWFADRQMGPSILTYGTDDAEEAVPARASSAARPGGASA